MLLISVTRPTLHALRSSSNVARPLKSECISVHSATSHAAIGPYVASVAARVAVSNHASTAS
eukprot:4072748-Prymnesium_polylepis.1